MKQIIAVIIFSCLIFRAESQFSESIKLQLVKDWERAKTYTKEYLDVMPKNQYGFKALDSIRSFAQQMLHLSQGTVGLISSGTGNERLAWAGRNLEKAPGAQSADSVAYFVMASYDYAIASIKAIDPSKLEEKVKRGNTEETRFAWLMKAFEHQTHHRGQATIYIRLLGIKPPNEKLF